MNLLTVTGNITKDALLRHTNNGKAVLSFDLANNQGFGDKKHTEYYKCAVWGNRATNLAEHLTKGTKLIVVGQHQTEKREFNGKTYFDNKLDVREIDFAGSRNSESAPQESQQQAPAPEQQTPTPAPANDFDDDIPF